MCGTIKQAPHHTTMVEIHLANWEPIAKAAYLGYGSVAEPRTGIPLPHWETLSSEEKQAWIVASKKAAEEVISIRDKKF